jgi:hypothetical protein
MRFDFRIRRFASRKRMMGHTSFAVEIANDVDTNGLPFHLGLPGAQRQLDRSLMRNGSRVSDQYAVAGAADLERACLMRRRESHALTRCKNRHNTDRCSGHALRKGGDDMETIAFDGVVGDTRHLAEVDAPGINRTQAIGVGRLQRG